MPHTPCASCGSAAPHRVVDDEGASPACTLCLIAALGELDDQPVTITVMVGRTAAVA